MLGFDEAGGDYRDILFAERGVGASRFCFDRIRRDCLPRCCGRIVGGGNQFFRSGR